MAMKKKRKVRTKSDKLSGRQELFAQGIVQGKTQRQAYIDAGFKSQGDEANDANASRLISTDKLRARISELQAQITKNTEVTVGGLMADAEAAREMAMSAANPSAAVSAITLRAKLAGLLIERREDMVARDQLEVDRIERAKAEERSKAGALLIDAAKALGLKSTATAEEIMRAASDLPYAPPAVQALLHAATKKDGDRVH